MTIRLYQIYDTPIPESANEAILEGTLADIDATFGIKIGCTETEALDYIKSQFLFVRFRDFFDDHAVKFYLAGDMELFSLRLE